jgi:pimeloyl-ACP methyl ester carboxylesterase
MIEGWFLDVPLINIHFGNMAQWTAWAFFGKDVKEMSSEEIEENNEIVHSFEQVAKWRFPSGFANDVHALRLELDPIFATQRPFLFYFCIALLNLTFHLLIVKGFLGFEYLEKFTSPSKGQRVYRRKARINTITSNSDTTHVNSKPKLPIVFMHGIGIGFLHYWQLLFALPTDVDIFLLEWPYVSMQMSTNAPTAEESILCIHQVLETFHHEKAVFVAHSLGTVLISWMLHHPITAKHVAHSVLIDPVNFVLCEPTVASVFVYKDPQHWIDLCMHFFLSRELFISNALSRHFAWSYNIMFVEEFMNNKKCCNYHHHHKHSYGHNYQRTTAYLQPDGEARREDTADSRASKDNDHGNDAKSIIRNQNQNQNHDEIGSTYMNKEETNLVQIKRHVCSLAHQQIEHTVS